MKGSLDVSDEELDSVEYKCDSHLTVRVGEHYRALGLDKSEGVVWFWIGTHAEYDKILS